MDVVWLGERACHDRAVVGGKAADPTVLVRQVADKHRMSVAAASGTREVGVPRLLRTRPALDEGQIVELARLALALEQQMGWPVDVEYAYQHTDLYLLQCRPITALSRPGVPST
jgi:phosphoenolpyruvate synthase/pyruvate phosphate dikinase